ncbi:hypothetical protein M514_01329, partial [Trichuris suis]
MARRREGRLYAHVALINKLPSETFSERNFYAFQISKSVIVTLPLFCRFCVRLQIAFDMSDDSFCGIKLKGKVTLIDAASLLLREEEYDEGQKGVPITVQESFTDKCEEVTSADVVCLQSPSVAEESQIVKRRPKRKKEKKGIRSDPFDELKAEEAAIEKIKERFLRPQYERAIRKSRRRTVKEPMIVVHNGNLASAQVYNTAVYEKSISAMKGLNARYFMKPSILAEVIPTPEICALCQEPAGYENLGFLCGPYYIAIATSKHWPPFLHENLKPHDQSMIYEAGLKFHIRHCPTAPDLERVDKFIIGIQEHMPKYWKQKCCLCKCVGATVHCNGSSCHKIYHFPCAISS